MTNFKFLITILIISSTFKLTYEEIMPNKISPNLYIYDKDEAFLGKWKFHQIKCLNVKKYDKIFDRINITDSKIEFYLKNFKNRNLITLEEYELKTLDLVKEKVFQTNTNTNKELWVYNIDSTRTKLKILKINDSSKEFSLFNQLNYGYFEKVE